MNIIEALKETGPMKFRIGLAVLGALLIGIIFYIVSSFSLDNSPPLISLPKQAPLVTPTPIRSEMYTEPLSIETAVGKRFEVNIVIDAKNTIINGVDSVISYDPTMLRVVQVAAPTTQDKTLSLMRRQIEDGNVYITSIKTEVTDIPTQELAIATLSIQALKSGTTTLTFEHAPATTTGSTIIRAQGSENILDKVTNTTIIVK